MRVLCRQAPLTGTSMKVQSEYQLPWLRMEVPCLQIARIDYKRRAIHSLLLYDWMQLLVFLIIELILLNTITLTSSSHRFQRHPAIHSSRYRCYSIIYCSDVNSKRQI